MSFTVDVKEPVFADNILNICDFGAISDGKTLNTDAINKAINECARIGGGQVIIPKGLWLTGPIILQSNINLHLEAGALVVFTPDHQQYPIRSVDLNGVKNVIVTAPIFGEKLENIAITGTGIFDGFGHFWRPVKKFKMTEKQWVRLIDSGGVLNESKTIWWPNKDALNSQRRLEDLIAVDAPLKDYDEVRTYLRPRLLQFINCRSIMLDGPTFQNSPMWNIHPLLCEDIIIRNIFVRNPWYSQNGDGLDLESCRNVLVENSIFDVGDDAICLKSGKDEMGRKIGVPTEQVLIRDCTVYHGHGGFVIGSEMSGGVRNVTVKNCQFIGTDVGLRFKSTRGRGGIVEDISVEQIDMINIEGAAIILDLYYETGIDNEQIPKVSIETPQFKNVSFDQITCRGADIGIFLRGLPEMPLENLEFNNVMITANNGVSIVNSENHQFNQVTITDVDGNILFNK